MYNIHPIELVSSIMHLYKMNYYATLEGNRFRLLISPWYLSRKVKLVETQLFCEQNGISLNFCKVCQIKKHLQQIW